MNAPLTGTLTRRGLLAGAGGLLVSFSLLPHALAQSVAPAQPHLPGSLETSRSLDAWIRIDPNGHITVFTGKAELGQGVRTALLQVAAEELDVPPGELEIITADTARTPNEGYTAGSQSAQYSGTALRHAAAQVRQLLIEEAARRLELDPSLLKTEGKAVRAPDGRSLGYGALVSDQFLRVEAKPVSILKKPDSYRYIGHSLPRVDIPGKVSGGEAYVHDMRLEGMLHARVVRPAIPRARLVGVDASAVETMPGVVAVIRDGDFLAVVAQGEFQAVTAMHALADLARWEPRYALPDHAALPAYLQKNESTVGTVAASGDPDKATGKVFEATYTRPYQLHASIGPSCGVAVLKDGQLTVWSHTQGVYPDRAAIAEMLGMPPNKVRVIHREGAGCYGHNGADDAAADAALIASKLPGRPIRLLWMRDQEHAGEPFGAPMLMKIRATLGDDGRIAGWNYDLWSNDHNTRPGGARSLLAAQAKENPFPPPVPKLAITPNGNGDRNANPLYDLPNKRVLWHYVEDMPLRISALRGLGAYANVVAIESSIDELALMANADPVEFRLRHLSDPRARDVVELAAKRFGWSNDKLPPHRGRGFAFAKYKNLAAYLAIAAEVEVERETGRVRLVRAVSAIDTGEAINPDGIINQTEGGILQATSWTLYEAVTFDENEVTRTDWSSYPILRFSSVPDKVEVHVINRPGLPFLGTAEAAQGPTGAALANAVRHATGKRIYDLPLSRQRVKQAIGI